jgi:hypothetical protein
VSPHSNGDTHDDDVFPAHGRGLDAAARHDFAAAAAALPASPGEDLMDGSFDLFGPVPDVPLTPPSAEPRTPPPAISSRERRRRRKVLKALARAMPVPPKRWSPDLDVLLKQMHRAGQKLPRLCGLGIRWRNTGGEIKRRVHEKPGNVEFDTLTTAGAQQLQYRLLEDSILRLTEGDFTLDDIAETWAWIDRDPDPANPLSFDACLTVYADQRDVDAQWLRDGIERRRPRWLLDHTLEPKAYATYWLALVLG